MCNAEEQHRTRGSFRTSIDRMEALIQCFHQVKQTEKPSVKNLFWSIGYNKKKLRGGVVVGRLGGNIRNNFEKKLTFIL
jgi:hypothetical protein